MAKSSKDAYGAVSTFNGLRIKPEDLVIIGEDCDADVCPALDDPDRAGAPLASLVDSVAAHGIKEPILIRKLADGRVIVVDGRQRVKAARLANERINSKGGEVGVLVPCVVDTTSDEEASAVTMIVANEHRREATPVERARKAQAMRDLGHDDKAIALMFGVSGVTISNWKRLLSVDPKILAKVEKGEIPAALAIEAAKFPPGEQLAAIEKAAAATGDVGGKATREVLARSAGIRLKDGPAKSPSRASKGDDESDGDDEPAEPSAAWGKRQMRELLEYLDPNHFEKPEKCNAATWAAFGMLAMILGDDPKGEALKGIETGDFGDGDDLRRTVLQYGPIAAAKRKAREEAKAAEKKGSKK
jgi:ParB family chromosome partitioning protein